MHHFSFNYETREIEPKPIGPGSFDLSLLVPLEFDIFESNYKPILDFLNFEDILENYLELQVREVEFKHPPLTLPELAQALKIPTTKYFQYWYNHFTWKPLEMEEQLHYIQDEILQQQSSFATNPYNSETTHFSGVSYQGSNSTPSTLIQYYLAPEEQMFGTRTSLSFTQAGQGPRRSERQQKLLRSAKDGGDEVMSDTHYTEDSGEEIDPRESETEDRGQKRVGFASDPKEKQVVRRGTTRSPSPLNIDEETFREMM